MSILGSNMLAGAAGRARHEIERSLRFNSGDAAYLNRTPGSAGNRRTFTFSCWCKRSKLGIDATLFSAATNTDNFFKFAFKDDNRFEINTYENGDSTQMFTTAVFRDVSSWYHIVVAFDTTQATAANRVKLYVNGTQVTAFDNNTLPPQNRETVANATGEHQVGNQINNTRYFDGYIAEVNQVDGLQLGPEFFGQTELETGAWIPKQYSGSYGTNGFHLKFADNSAATATTLGKDSSGKGNNFTPNNFSVTAGADNDSLFDTPTNNFCTANSVYAPSSQSLMDFANGNLDVGQAATNKNCSIAATFGMSTGKWYWEVTNKGSQNFRCIGMQTAEATAWRGTGTVLYRSDGQKFIDGTNSLYGASYTTNDVLGFAYDADAGSLTVYKNNTSQGVIFSSGAGKTYMPCVHDDNAGSGVTYFHNLNFGQRAFAYTPPAGFRALNAKNLPVPTIPNGAKYFDTVLYTGNGSSQNITGLGFAPDFVWGKAKSTSHWHTLVDIVRGAGNLLFSNSGNQEEKNVTGISAFLSNGFTVGDQGNALNNSGESYVAWSWKAGGAASNNSDGSTNGLVSANPDAGFSIVGYTGTGSETTVGHGLGVTPGMIWVKNRDAVEGWIIDSRLITGNANGTLHFNTDAEYTGGTNQFGTHSSSIFTVKTSGNINTSGQGYVAYCFAEVEGYSKFGSYTGNFNVEGPFIYTGFRPAFILVKSVGDTGHWLILDSARDTYNYASKSLFPSNADSELLGFNEIDFLSNGFKLRNPDRPSNFSVGYVYMAFAETPFKYANAR